MIFQSKGDLFCYQKHCIRLSGKYKIILLCDTITTLENKMDYILEKSFHCMQNIFAIIVKEVKEQLEGEE